MKPDLGFVVGVFLFAPFDPVLIVVKGMPWEFMEINYFLREFAQHLVSETPKKQDDVVIIRDLAP